MFSLLRLKQAASCFYFGHKTVKCSRDLQMFAKRSICNHRIMLVTLLVVGGCLVTHVDGHSIRRKDMEPVAAPVPPKKFVWMEDEVLVDDNDQDLFVPTPQEIQEFQQILLKGLGLSRAPDMSKANVSRDEYDRVYADYQLAVKQSKDRQLVIEDDYESPLQRQHLVLTPDSVTVYESKIKSGRRRADRTASREWAMHFRPHLSPAQWSWSVENPRLEVRWINRKGSEQTDAEALGRPDLSLRMEVVNEAGRAADTVIEADLKSQKWLEQQSLTFDLSNLVDWSERNNSLQFRMICAGRACGILSGHHLSSRLRMDLLENGLTRTKRSRQLKDILKVHDKKRADKGSDCTKEQKKCCRKSLKVRFRDLDAFAWIVEPRVADLYMCKGQCKYPHHMANNHALLQGFMHHRDKTKAPKLCCTPSKLEGLKVLYVRDDDPTKLAVAEWDNAVVTECACS